MDISKGINKINTQEVTKSENENKSKAKNEETLQISNNINSN